MAGPISIVNSHFALGKGSNQLEATGIADKKKIISLPSHMGWLDSVPGRKIFPYGLQFKIVTKTNLISVVVYTAFTMPFDETDEKKRQVRFAEHVQSVKVYVLAEKLQDRSARNAITDIVIGIPSEENCPVPKRTWNSVGD